MGKEKTGESWRGEESRGNASEGKKEVDGEAKKQTSGPTWWCRSPGQDAADPNQPLRLLSLGK